MTDLDAAICELAADRRMVNAAALGLYRRTRSRKPRVYPVAEYRCDSGRSACLLLAVYPSPVGPLVYAPSYRYSPAEAERQGLTVRAFPERAFMLAELPADDGALVAWAVCRHRVLSIRPAALWEDYRRGLAGWPVGRFLPDGTTEAHTFR